MYRSSSTQRASEFFMHGSSSPKVRNTSTDTEEELLPTYDPLSDFAKKEKLRAKFAENAVHVIPLVLVLCAVVLWFFSSPELEMGNKDASVTANIEGLTIDGDIEVTSTETGLLSDLEDLEPPPNQDKTKTDGRSSEKLF